MATILLVALPELDLPGTQPGELTQDLRSPSVCADCHGGYAEYAAMDTWAGSMMANAMRDPLFLAALTVANQDVPESGELCIRCHSPRAFLFGRATPADGSALVPEDDESVQCDFCHRLVEGPGEARLIGNGQFFVADDVVRRGTLMDPLSPHDWAYSAYHESSELCGLCHDVSNPLENDFPIERTYSEWQASAFPGEGVSCRQCHLPRVEPGYVSGAPNMPERAVGRHDLVGGNTWIPLVLAGEYPELGREDAYQYTATRARQMLEDAAELSLQLTGVIAAEPGATAPSVVAGEFLGVVVRVENLTGHKLPTGYAEGRQCWLEVTIRDVDGNILYQSGGYDQVEARRIEDPDLHTYEILLGADGEEGFHFILSDQILQDNRIPPRGFRPTVETQPVGRTYPEQPDGSLAHWDEVTYDVAIPLDAALGAATVETTLWYQTTSREYVEFLRDENVTDDRGQDMYDLWDRYGRSPPVAMVRQEMVVGIQPPPSSGGCAATDAERAPFGVILLGLLVFGVRRRGPEERKRLS